MKNTFTEADLVRFGNYLLSEKREHSIQNKENIREVHQEDLNNFDVFSPKLTEEQQENLKFRVSWETAEKAMYNNIPESMKRIKRFSVLIYCLKAVAIILYTWFIIKLINN